MQENKFLRSVFKGTIGTIIISLVGIIMLSAIMTKFQVRSSIRNMITVVTVLVSVSAGSIIAAKKNESKGMLVGMCVGILFYAIYFITISILSGSLMFSAYDFGKLVIVMITGMLAGILGVNIG